MTGTEVALIITASGTFITTVTGVLISLLNGRKIDRSEIVTTQKLDVLHDTTNSKMDKLLKVTASASRAEGVKAGQEGEKKPPDKAPPEGK